MTIDTTVRPFWLIFLGALAFLPVPSVHAQTGTEMGAPASSQQRATSTDEEASDAEAHGRSEGSKIPMVVELFTSQICKPCPPADEELVELADRDDLVVLSWHVDYWSDREWTDNFAIEEASDRQIGYRDMLGLNALFTPQMVIGGRWSVPGSMPGEVKNRLSEAMNADLPRIELSSWVEGDKVTIAVPDRRAWFMQQAPKDQNIVLLLVPTIRKSNVMIGGGANAGKTLSYVNIVRSKRGIAMWDGSPMNIELPVSELGAAPEDVAILLQHFVDGHEPGPILGATWIAR